MMIRSFTNSKSEAFYVVGFSSLDERHRMFTALTESAVFLHNLREHMEFSELLTRLEKRDAGRIDIPGIVSAIPLRNSEMNLNAHDSEVCHKHVLSSPSGGAAVASSFDSHTGGNCPCRKTLKINRLP